MKKLLSLCLSAACINTAYPAENQAHLQVKVTNSPPGYYLCVSNVGGCISFAANQNGKRFPMNEGKIVNIVVMDTVHRQAHTVNIPNSCNVPVQKGQTMTISGTLKHTAANDTYISQLNCAVG